MAILRREQILSASDIVTETVSVPEWGGEVLVRGLTGKQRSDIETAMIEFRGSQRVYHVQNVYATYAAASIVDERGNQLFTLADVEALGQKNAAALARVWNVVQRLSGLSESDAKEFAKN
jgi:hypothetical protein